MCSYLLLRSAGLARRVSFLVLLAACWFTAGVALAQTPARPLIDGATVGLGVTIFQGDLDSNPDNNPFEFLTAGNVGLMAGVDRQYGKMFAGLELHYNRISAEEFGIRLSNTLVSLDAIGGRGFPFIRPDLFSVYAGLGATLLAPSYKQTPENMDGFRDIGARFVMTVPLGIIIQNRVRLGMRLTNTDYLDGFEGQRWKRDVISFVHVSYRFPMHP